MIDKRKWLVGRWEHSTDLSEVVYEINEGPQGLVVRSFNKEDGEEAVVSKTRWDGEALRFELYWRSTKYRTIDVFTPICATKAINEYTFWEPWVKDPQFRKPVQRIKAVRGKMGWLIGSWSDGGYLDLEIEVRKTPRYFRVLAHCPSDDEEVVVSKTKWDGRELRFETFIRSVRWRIPHAMRPVSKTRVIHEMTWRHLYVKVDPKKRGRAKPKRTKK